MPTTRLQLPLSDYQGARAAGTIKTIQAGMFQTADDRLMQSGSGVPIGSTTSHWAGQLYLDTASKKVWCNGLASDAHNWVQLQEGELVSLSNAAVFHNNESLRA